MVYELTTVFDSVVGPYGLHTAHMLPVSGFHCSTILRPNWQVTLDWGAMKGQVFSRGGTTLLPFSPHVDLPLDFSDDASKLPTLHPFSIFAPTGWSITSEDVWAILVFCRAYWAVLEYEHCGHIQMTFGIRKHLNLLNCIPFFCKLKQLSSSSWRATLILNGRLHTFNGLLVGQSFKK